MKKVYFVGAGPGDPKLITVKGKELLESADIVIYTGSLINPEMLKYTKGEKIDSYGLSLEELVDIMSKKVIDGKKVVRLHSGDPSLYGAIVEQIDALSKNGIDVEIIPGVSSLFASTATLKTQLTLSGITQSLIVTRPEGKTLESDSIKELSKHNATMAIFLGVHKIREIMEKVEYPKDTPVAVVYHASWNDEQIICGTVSNIADKVESAKINKFAIILIGDVLQRKSFRRSHLYALRNNQFFDRKFYIE
ncbi:MAG TPA: precorrin-4 C(11)-methyltransferase [Methanosarcinales archaeon]|nr:precorrin-4 C(11)-methyltransferase [Methanosarcinales archaeon]